MRVRCIISFLSKACFASHLRFLFLSVFSFSTQAFSDSSINAIHRYAYGANVGWLDFRGDNIQGAVLGQFYATGYVWSANCGWICLGNGPTNGFAYSNTSVNDWGVNHDGLGNLRGYAYGANIGWINFEENGNPTVHLQHGRLSGFIYGANVGWIDLSNTCLLYTSPSPRD